MPVYSFAGRQPGGESTPSRIMATFGLSMYTPINAISRLAFGRSGGGWPGGWAKTHYPHVCVCKPPLSVTLMCALNLPVGNRCPFGLFGVLSSTKYCDFIRIYVENGRDVNHVEVV